MLDHIRSRLHLVPRYRQRLAEPPLETGRPLWVDDPTFNLEYHVRQTALPAPGTEDQLLRAGRPAHLPAARPLQAAVGDVDRRGPRGRRLRADLQDPPRARRRHLRRRPRDGPVRPLPRAAPTSPHPTSRGSRAPSRPAPSWSPAARSGLAQARRSAASAARSARWPRPQSALRGAREARRGRRRGRLGGLNPAPDTPLNVEIGPHRRYARRAQPARRLQAGQERLRRHRQRRRADRRQRRAARLAALARRAHRGPRAARARAGLDRAAATSADTLGNRIAAMRGPLPVYIDDPVARLRVVKAAMDGLKESKQARRRRGARRRAELRAADDPRAGLAAELLHAPVQPDRDQRAGPAVPALRARARDGGRLPDRVPAQEPRAGDRDHVLQRRR